MGRVVADEMCSLAHVAHKGESTVLPIFERLSLRRCKEAGNCVVRSVDVDFPADVGWIAAEHKLAGSTEKGGAKLRVSGSNVWLPFMVFALDAKPWFLF